MRLSIRQRERYVLLSFYPEGKESVNLLKEVVPIIADPVRFPVFDFTPMKKVDFQLLTQLEPAIKLLNDCDQQAAICCFEPTVQSVLETSGLLSGITLYASEKELAHHIVSREPESPARQAGPTAPLPKTGSRLERILSAGSEVKWAIGGLFLFLLALAVGQQIWMNRAASQWSRAVSALRLSLDSLRQAVEIDLREKAFRTEMQSPTRALARPSFLLETARGYGHSSKKLRATAGDFLSAQDAFFQQHGRYASRLEELGWSPTTGVKLHSLATTPMGDHSRAAFSIRTPSQLSLSWTVETDRKWRSAPPAH